MLNYKEFIRKNKHLEPSFLFFLVFSLECPFFSHWFSISIFGSYKMMGTTLIRHFSSLKTNHIFSLRDLLLIRCVFQGDEHGESNCRNYRVLSYPYEYFNRAAKVSTEFRALLCPVKLVRKVSFWTYRTLKTILVFLDHTDQAKLRGKKKKKILWNTGNYYGNRENLY